MSNNVIVYREIQKEIMAFLSNYPTLEKKNYYIDDQSKMKENWITIDYHGSDGLSFKNRIEKDQDMRFVVMAQIRNTNKTTGGKNRIAGDDIAVEINTIFNALNDWFCRTDIVTYPYCKYVYAADVSVNPVIITKENKKQNTNKVIRATSFDIRFTYREN